MMVKPGSLMLRAPVALMNRQPESSIPCHCPFLPKKLVNLDALVEGIIFLGL